MAICIMENVEFGATPQLHYTWSGHGCCLLVTHPRLISAERKKLLLAARVQGSSSPLPQTRRLDTGQQLTAPNSCFLGKLILKQSQINHYYPHKMGQ